MSQNISATRDSTSSPPHNDSKRNILHPPQPYSATPTSTIAPIVSTSTSFTSQLSDVSGPSTIIGSPAARPRERALDVSTILNPSPQRQTRIAPYDASRRPSLANINSPVSPPGFLGRRGPDPSRPPSPIEVDLRRAPSVPLPGPGPIRRHARNSLPGVLSVQEHPFPIMSPPRGSPAFRSAGLMGAPGTSPASSQLHRPPPIPPPSLQQQITSSAGQNSFSSSSGDAYTHALSPAPASTYHAAAPPYPGGHQGTMADQGVQMHQGHYGMGLGSQHGSGHVMVNTPDGAMVAPLDITSGSMAQHEKRRKNASASSRFRKRKKEKEAENSRRMEELEQNLKRAEEERERYRQERDYYRQLIVHAQQQGGQLPPLPAGLFESTTADNTGRDDGQRIGGSGDTGVSAGMAMGVAGARGIEGMGLPVPEGMGGIGGGQSSHTGTFGGSQPELQRQQQHHNVPSHQQQPPAHPEPQPPPSRGRGRGRSRGSSRGREF